MLIGTNIESNFLYSQVRSHIVCCPDRINFSAFTPKLKANQGVFWAGSNIENSQCGSMISCVADLKLEV